MILLAALLLTHQAPDLRVDLGAPTHPISPYIYGMNDNGGDVDQALAKEIRLPASRWGGDATTRYNWQVDGSNSGDDWFFMAGSGKADPTPSASADAFVQRAIAYGGIAILTIPIIDYINSAKATDCSFPVSVIGAQQKVNPYVHPTVNGSVTDAGNGKKPDGTPIILTQEQILRVHIPNKPEIQTAWVAHMMATFGAASKGGVKVYQMDNEPSGWAATHRDVHPNPPPYSEIIEKTIRYATAIKATDPSALILGPGDFGWPAYKGSPEKQGNLWNAELYLKELAAASKASGKRLLDVFDEHYYPTTDDGLEPIALAPAGNAATQKLRLRSTRSLWDPEYKENNWIGKYGGAIQLIPRLKGWVAQYFPGLKTAITEYNFGGQESINGALAQADALGIFGREGLDIATLWGTPKADQPAAFSFRLFRNYDGAGSTFGDVSVKAVSADPDQVAIFAGKTAHGLTILVINKSGTRLQSTIAGLPAGHSFRSYSYGPRNLKAIVKGDTVASESSGLPIDIPGSTITLYVTSI